MPYGYPYQNPTPSYFNTNYAPTPTPNFQTQQQPSPTSNVSWIYVNGISGAKEHIVQPCQTAWMMDNNSPAIYIKAADAMGAVTFKAYRLEEITDAPVKVSATDMEIYATKADLDTVAIKLAKIEEALGGFNT